MNIFTNDDYRRIQAWLKANAIKDSDLVQSETTIPDEDILTIVQKVNGIPTNFKINIKDFLNSSLNKTIIELFAVNTIKVNNSLVVDIDKIIINEEENLTLQAVFDSFNNQLNDVSSASKGWNIEYQAPSIDEPTVRAKYVLKDYKGVPKGDPIKVYKDSAITNVYLGTTEDTCNENTGEVTKKPIQNNNEALSIVYRLDTGKYSLVNIPIGIFIKEAEFDKYRGLGITENGQVFIKLANDVESSNYLHFNDSGEVSADGIESRILQDLGTIINSVVGDGTMWGQYKKEEGTKDSAINDSSRWGQYKQAEATRNERLNNLENKIEEVKQEIIYDVSAHNGGAVFKSLQDLLSSSNLNTFIPTSVRHGGMTIKFIQGSVQSSDNKYVQYRLISNTWSTNIEDWTITEEGIHIDNPEFVYVKTDADNRLLWWIYKDGSIDWSKGVPTPIQKELKKLEQLIKDNTEGDESVVVRVTANEAAIMAINEALDRKVDGVYEDNPEYVRLNKDADERILNGIKIDGTNYLPKANVDTLSLADKEVDNDSVLVNKCIDSPEFIRYYCDAEDKLLWWIENDGTINWSKGVPRPIQVKLQELRKTIPDDSHIKDIAREIVTPGTDIFDFNDYGYVKGALENLNRRSINPSTGLSEGTKPLVLSVLGDIHGSWVNADRYGRFNIRYNQFIQDSVQVGDIAPSSWDNYVSFSEVPNWNNTLICIGNHDNFNAPSALDLYNRYFAYASQWGITQPSDAGTQGKCYYYKDYSEEGIRLIALNSEIKTDNDQEQMSWFASVLSDARSKNYSVIVMQHIPVADTLDFIECPFTSPQIDSYGGDGNFPNSIKAVDDFIKAGGKFICWLHGHTHTDYIGTVPMNYKGYQLSHKQLVVVVGGGMLDTRWQDTERVANEKSQDMFDIISVETVSKQLRILRIGAEWSQYLQHKTAIVIDYEKGLTLNYN